MTDQDLPRFYSNGVNVAGGPYDVTITFMTVDPTALPEGQEGPKAVTMKSAVQVVSSWGHLKAVLPLLVKAIADYESHFGIIPAPGFEEGSKS